MKEHWPRYSPPVALDEAAVARIVLPAFPGHKVISVEPVKGGLINTNLKVRLSGRSAPLLLRVYQRGLASAQKEMAVCGLVGARLAVPHFVHFCARDPITGHPYAIIDWIDGLELQAMFASLSAKGLAALAGAIGGVLATVHGFTFDKFGFLAADLRIEEAIDLDKKGLLAYLTQSFVGGPGGARLGPALTSALLKFAAREGDILAAWLRQPCLVHGDFNGSNILIRERAGGSWEIVAIIDWEYAISASPAFDFGNLLRPPLDGNEDFAAALARGYSKAGGYLPAGWERIARLADMYSFADILSRPATNEVVVADARAAIGKLIAT